MPKPPAADLRPTLRAALAAHRPPRRGWTVVVRGLRARRRRTGEADPLAGRAAVEALLDRPLRAGAEPAAVARLAALLGEAARRAGRAGESPAVEERAAEVSALARALVVRVVEEPVSVRISGWPPGFGAAARARLLGRPPGELERVAPAEAARLVAALDGLALGGGRLRVEVALPPDAVLPPLSRRDRAEAGRRRRAPPWLPHLDEQGRLSLTPRPIARRQAAWLGAGRVLDPFCGCGGNAVAFARAGARVIAFERDPARAALARANFRAMGVADRVELRVGDGVARLPALLRRWPDAAVFVDPPWPPGATRWAELAPPGLEAALAPATAVMLKLPRALDPRTLPGGLERWRLRYEFGAAGPGEDAGLGRVVKMITALRRGVA